MTTKVSKGPQKRGPSGSPFCDMALRELGVIFEPVLPDISFQSDA